MISADQALELSYIPLFAWIAVYALAFILSMIGLILWRKPKEENAEEVYLEQISRAEEERARRQSEQKKRSREQEPNRDVRRQTGDVQKPEDYSRPGQEPPYADRNYRNPEMMHPEQELSVWAPPEQKNEVPVSAGLLQNRFILSHKMIFQGQFQEKADCMKERFILLQIKKKYSFL